MSELQEQQRAAFARLSAQYEREQRRHAEQIERQAGQIATLRQQVGPQAKQVEALRQQVGWLSGQVTSLAKDYRTLAATLREFLR